LLVELTKDDYELSLAVLNYLVMIKNSEECRDVRQWMHELANRMEEFSDHLSGLEKTAVHHDFSEYEETVKIVEAFLAKLNCKPLTEKCEEILPALIEATDLDGIEDDVGQKIIHSL